MYYILTKKLIVAFCNVNIIVCYSFLFNSAFCKIYSTIKKETSSKKKPENSMKNYIYELFIISQYKTRNEFRKSHQPEFSGEFWLFLNEWLFYISEILINEINIILYILFLVFHIVSFLYYLYLFFKTSSAMSFALKL